MRKIIVGAILGVLFLTLAWASIDYKNADSVAQAPPNEIDVTQAVANKNGVFITTEQWAYGDNLDKVDNLALYPNAQMALEEKHKINVDLDSGETKYADGKLTNKGVTLDLTAPGLKGAKIVALSGGGFSISKESSTGKFEYSGNEIDFKDSTGEVEVKPNGEIILPNRATLKDGAGNIITAFRDGLNIKKEGSTTTIKGVGKVETIPMIESKLFDDLSSEVESTTKTTSRTGYVGVGDSPGEVVFNPDQDLQFTGKNYVLSVSVEEENGKTSRTTSVFIDEEMHQQLKSIIGGESAKLKTQPGIAAELKPYFDPATAQELAWKLYTEYNPSAAIDKQHGLLALSRTSAGTELVPHFTGELEPATENRIQVPLLSRGDSGGVSGYYADTLYGKSAGAAFRVGEGEKIAVTTGLAPNPAVTYEKSFGGKVVAKVTVHPGMEETNAWVSIEVPMLQ